MTAEKLDFSKGRHRPADYISICRSIADSYPLGIPHGIQKDAIQKLFIQQVKQYLLSLLLN
jgi:hypothetical protein